MNFLMLANLYLALFYAFYWLCLRRETFFRYNRIYLTGSLILSFVSPLVQLPWVQDFFRDSTVVQVRAGFDEAWVNTQPVSEIPVHVASPFPVITVIYWTGTALAGLWLAYRLFRLRIRLNQFQGNQAYSFFRWLRIDPKQPGAMDILHHEQVHIKRLHSLDILLTELVILFNWFNPAVYFFARSIKLQHEYEADSWAVTCANNKAEYAELLVSHAFQVPLYTLTNNFYNRSFIKNRIVMLFKEKSKQRSLLKYAFAVPLFLSMMVFSSAGISDLKPAGMVSQAGGIQDFLRQLSHTIRYPQAAFDAGKEGIVGVAVVKESGQLQSVDIVGHAGFGMEKEVERATRLPRATEKLPDGTYFFYIKFGINRSLLTPVEDVPQQYKSYIYIDPIYITAFKTANLSAPSTSPFTGGSVDVKPEPRGGYEWYLRTIAKNFRYSREAINHRLKGKVVLSFVVNTKGELEQIKTLQDPGFGTAEEAIRLAKTTAKWAPGVSNHNEMKEIQVVSMSRTLAIPVDATQADAK